MTRVKKLPYLFPRRAILRTAAAVVLSLLFSTFIGFLLLFTLMILFGYRGGYDGTLIALLVSTTTAFSQTRTNNYLFNDSHFHLTNYIQEGIDIHDFLQPVRTFLEASDSGSERESAQEKLRADLR